MSKSHIFAGKPGGKPASPFAPDPRLDMALRNIGFNGVGASDAPPLTMPQSAPRPPAGAPATVQLQRREWLLEAMEAQRGLSTFASGLPRVRGLSSQDFLDHFYAPGRPVVIEGAISGWPALERWTPDYLRRAIGNAPVEYQYNRNSSPDFELYKDNHCRTGPFGEFMDLVEAPGAANNVYLTAYNSRVNGPALAPLMADVAPISAYLTEATGMLWIGPAGTFTPLHFDVTNNLLAQITGQKQIILIPPSETRHMAHNRHVFSDVRSEEHTSELQSH